MIWLSLQAIALMGWFLLASRHLLSMLLTLELLFLSFMLRFALYGWLVDDLTGLLMASVLLVMAGIESALLLAQMLLYHRHHGFPQVML